MNILCKTVLNKSLYKCKKYIFVCNLKSMKRLISFLTILAVLLLFYNNSANWHLHQLPNGIVIEHSHPFTKTNNSDSPFQKHSHSKLEILILGLISSHLTFIPIVIFGLWLLSFSQGFEKLILCPIKIVIQDFYPNYSPLRAPPINL
jgi:hypothetical protein